MGDTKTDKEKTGKYLLVMKSFIEHLISSEEFVDSFLDIRRNDDYLMSGHYSPDIEKILSHVFSVVDRHAPVELYEEGDVDDEELIRVVQDKYSELVRL